jgi:hypothetical protein
LDTSAQPVRSDRGLHFTSQLTSRQLGRQALGYVDVRSRRVAHAFDFETLADATLMRCLAGEARRANLLAQCATMREANAFVDRFVTWCDGPLYTVALPGILSLPAALTGTLLLKNIAASSMVQQLEIFDWLSARQSAMRVVSVTTAPLARLVDTGMFLQALFYRLNIIQLNATPTRVNRRQRLAEV